MGVLLDANVYLLTVELEIINETSGRVVLFLRFLEIGEYELELI